MKKLSILVIAAVSAALSVAYAEQAEHWTFDGAVITDNEWTFAATVKDGTTEMTVGAVIAWPIELATLDFSKPVFDYDKTYDIVKLDTALGSDAGGYYKSSTTLAGLAVRELYLPNNGKLTAIGERAFARMTNCTLVSPYIPDSVTSLGGGAFTACPAEQPLRLVGVQGTVNHNSFLASKITSVVFGPGLKEVAGAYGVGAFEGCKQLLSVTFDPGMSGGTFSGSSYGPFDSCSKLAGSIDLSGFSSLTLKSFSGTQITKVTIGGGTKIAGSFFDGMSKLSELHFLGSKPTITGTIFSGLGANQLIASFVETKDSAEFESWKEYAEGGVIDDFSSTWSQALAGANYANRYLVVDSGGGGGELGNWVFDGSEVSNGIWSFEATRVLKNLNIGACTKYPDEPALLDFTDTLTDADGVALTIKALNVALSSDKGVATTAASKVSEVRFPPAVVTIGAGAFGNLVNCTNVVNFLPDSVTTIGSYAFYKLPVRQDLSIKGVAYLGTGTAGSQATLTFGSSGITGVTFGPGLKEINSWSSSAFNGCKSLVRVTFDEKMSGGMFGGIRADAFYGCSALKGTVDLSGFSDLSYVSDSGGAQNPLSGTKVDTVIIGADCTKLGAKFFNGMGSLTTLKFMGPPPEIITTAKTSTGYNCRTAGKLFDDKPSSATIAVYVLEEYKDQWKAYSATGEINDSDTKWSKDWVGDADCYLLVEGGGGGGELGDWIFDNSDTDNPVVSNKLWSFSASIVIRNLTIGACVRYPDEVSTLDLSTRMTDVHGVELKLVLLNPQLNGSAQGSAGRMVGELRLPDGLKEISANAFNQCLSLTNIVNYIPDSVTKVGTAAFYKCPAEQTLYVRGVTHFGTGGNWGAGSSANWFSNNAFNGSKITRIVFGPGLKEIGDWDSGPFTNCKLLTNVTFDVAMTGGKFSGARNGGFYGCSALEGTIDLSGFSDLTYLGTVGGSGRVFNGTAITKVILGEGLTKVDFNFFDQMGKLEGVVFNSSPNDFTFTRGLGDSARMYGGDSSTKTITTYITKQYRAEWAPYVLYHGEEVDKVPPGRGVTWKPEYVSDGIDLSLRPVRIIDMEPGLRMVIR